MLVVVATEIPPPACKMKKTLNYKGPTFPPFYQWLVCLKASFTAINSGRAIESLVRPNRRRHLERGGPFFWTGKLHLLRLLDADLV
jgi:hypothetical protein